VHAGHANLHSHREVLLVPLASTHRAGIGYPATLKLKGSPMAEALRQHAIASFVALLLVIVLVWWLQPQEASGTTLLVAIVLAFVNLVAFVRRTLIRGGKSTTVTAPTGSKNPDAQA